MKELETKYWVRIAKDPVRGMYRLSPCRYDYYAARELARADVRAARAFKIPVLRIMVLEEFYDKSKC